MGGGAGFEESDESRQRLACVAKGIVKGVPIFAVLAIMIGDDIFEMVGEAKFRISVAGAALNIFQILE